MTLCRFLILSVFISIAFLATGQRRVTPVDNPATTTQSVNEFKGDTARINAYKRTHFAHYHDENGNIVYVDTVTGEEWRDSTTMKASVPKMEYPLLESMTFGVNILEPFMRAFGQKYGLGEVWGMLSLHNRYMPVVVLGLGQAKATPDDGNFTYKSGIAPYFKIGADYNFLYNSSTDYQFHAGMRFGFTSFKYEITDITVNDSYWQENPPFAIPSQTSSAFYWELEFSLRVKVWRNISAGWSVKYHRLVKDSSGKYGRAWYIPGYGSRGSTLGLGFSVMYTIPINKRKTPLSPTDDTLPQPPPSPSQEEGVLPGRAPGMGSDPFEDDGTNSPEESPAVPLQ